LKSPSIATVRDNGIMCPPYIYTDRDEHDESLSTCAGVANRFAVEISAISCFRHGNLMFENYPALEGEKNNIVALVAEFDYANLTNW
jgi:hypothetical protein